MEKFIRSENAVSSVVGMIMILALTIASASVIFLYGVPTIYEMEDMANAQKVEQAFTVLDSRTSKVALGESPSQTTSLSMMGGNLEVKGNNESYNESRVVVISVDIDASWYNNFKNNRYRWGSWENYTSNPGMNEFNASMGSIVYRDDDRTIGYEGGGVWSKYPTGKSVMISPPEFHYNGETLTLPVMKIEGDKLHSGKSDVDITVSSNNMPIVLYPDPGSDTRRTNPLTSDKVIIYIKSDFYNAWADYANTLAYATATTDDINKTAVVELEVIPAMGKDTLRTAFKVGSVNPYNPEPIYNFSFDLEARASQGLNPSNYQITATSGTKTLTYIVAKKGGANQLQIDLEYEDTASGGGTETWDGDTEFIVSGSNEDQSCNVDLLSKTLTMKYEESSDFSWDNDSTISVGPNVDYTSVDHVPLYNLTQHYMKLITMDGSVVFNLQQPGHSDPVDYDESTLTLYYDGMPGSITYLHVSRNDLSVNLN
jgi:hypothetical protein